MKLAPLVAALACLLVPISAHAGVIYEWRPTNESTPRNITIQLEFTQQSVDGGTFTFAVPYGDGAASYPDSGLLSFLYTFPGNGGIVSYKPPLEKFRNGLGILNVDIRFEADGYLSGRIYANNAESHIDLLSAGTLFTVRDANSDAGMPGAGCGRSACGGATGYLRDTRMNAVPEPASGGLLIAGALGAMAAFRARRRKS